MLKIIVFKLSVFIFFTGCAGAGQTNTQKSSLPEKGSFSLVLDTVEGDVFNFNDIRGKKHLLVAFWATWCEPCKTELRKLSEMYPDYSEKVEFVAVSIDTEESLDRVDMFVIENNIPFPVLIDPAGNAVASMIPGGETVPYTILVSKSGEIVARHTGYRPGEEKIIKREIEKLIENE